MNIFTRYIGGQLLLTIFSLITVLTCLIWLAQSLQFVEMIAGQGADTFLFLKMLISLLPSFVVIVIPISVLLGVVFIYNKLIHDHEVMIMQASGMSYLKLVQPALLVGGLFTLIMYVFTLYILPVSFHNFRDIEYGIKKGRSVSMLQAGRFNNVGKYTVYLREKYPDGEAKGVFIYHNMTAEGKKPSTYIAENAMIFDSDEGKIRIVLFNGSNQQKNATTGRPEILYFDQYTLETENGLYNKARIIKPYELFLPDLLFPTGDMKKSIRQKMIASGHERLLSPLYCLVFAMLGAAILAVGKYNRRGRMGRIAFIAVCGFLFYLVVMVCLHTIKSLSVTIPAAYGLILFIFFGLWIRLVWPDGQRRKGR